MKSTLNVRGLISKAEFLPIFLNNQVFITFYNNNTAYIKSITSTGFYATLITHPNPGIEIHDSFSPGVRKQLFSYVFAKSAPGSCL
jgi:hypothetical protein